MTGKILSKQKTEDGGQKQVEDGSETGRQVSPSELFPGVTSEKFIHELITLSVN